MLCFLDINVWRFALLPYYRQIQKIETIYHEEKSATYRQRVKKERIKTERKTDKRQRKIKKKRELGYDLSRTFYFKGNMTTGPSLKLVFI